MIPTESSRMKSGITVKHRFLGWLFDNLTIIAGSLTLVMIFAILREVVGRYFFNKPSDWSLELSGYLLVGVVYLGAADTEMKDEHVRIDFVYSRYGKKMKWFVDVFCNLIGLVWCSILVWQGYLLASHSFLTDARSATIMRWPLFPAQSAVVLGSFLAWAVLAAKLLTLIFKANKSEK